MVTNDSNTLKGATHFELILVTAGATMYSIGSFRTNQSQEKQYRAMNTNLR